MLSYVLIDKPAHTLPQPPHARFLFASSTFLTSASLITFAQSLPTFSTASKHSTCGIACNMIRFMCLLHSSHHTPGGGAQSQAVPLFRSRLCLQFKLPRAAPLTAFGAILADSLQLAENPVTLSPFPANLTTRVNPNPFVCHSYKNTGVGGAVGGPPFQT
jgi:hypothetical protein